jgi:hypothetical protein
MKKSGKSKKQVKRIREKVFDNKEVFKDESVSKMKDLKKIKSFFNENLN